MAGGTDEASSDLAEAVYLLLTTYLQWALIYLEYGQATAEGFLPWPFIPMKSASFASVPTLHCTWPDLGASSHHGIRELSSRHATYYLLRELSSRHTAYYLLRELSSRHTTYHPHTERPLCDLYAVILALMTGSHTSSDDHLSAPHTHHRMLPHVAFTYIMIDQQVMMGKLVVIRALAGRSLTRIHTLWGGSFE